MIFMDTRRAGVPPASIVLADVDDSEIPVPFQIAVKIVAVETFRAEEGDEVLAVDSEAGIRLGSFDMTRGAGHALMRGFAPEFFAGLFVETQNDPLVIAGVIRGGGLTSGA